MVDIERHVPVGVSEMRVAPNELEPGLTLRGYLLRTAWRPRVWWPVAGEVLCRFVGVVPTGGSPGGGAVFVDGHGRWSGPGVAGVPRVEVVS